MKTIILPILLLFNIFNIYAQYQDSVEIQNCNQLVRINKLQESLECYKAHDKNINAIYGAATIAKYLHNKKEFNRLSKKLISREIESPGSYFLYCQLFSQDSSKYIKLINKGLTKYKHDTILLIEKSNYYLGKKDLKEAIACVHELLKYKKDDNKTLYFALGYLSDRLNDEENARKYLLKAIKKDSLYFDAYFNLGVNYFNQAVKIYKRANKILNNQQYKILKEQGDQKLREALPYFLKAKELRPTHEATLEALKTIYSRLRIKNENDFEEEISPTNSVG